ncbi:MAG: tRNA (cytidine(34)-2'-O)-methyltransferase [Elusimicrobiaceae bacterium]
MNIVLINPEIPFNTGNIGRSCVATGSTLHLVGKLGFKIEDKEIRRSGLDYWPKLKYKRYQDFEEFLSLNQPDSKQLIFFSTKGKQNFWQAEYHPDSCLVFGCESAGLPAQIYETYQDRLFRIPVSDDVRSLNLSASAAIALYHALYRTMPDTTLLKF